MQLHIIEDDAFPEVFAKCCIQQVLVVESGKFSTFNCPGEFRCYVRRNSSRKLVYIYLYLINFYCVYGSFQSICTSSKFLIFFFWLIPTPMVITRWDIAIWGVRTTKKPQIWPYFGPRAHSEVSEGKFQNFEKKVQRAITGAFFNPDTKCHTISESSGQCGFNHVRPIAHRDN